MERESKKKNIEAGIGLYETIWIHAPIQIKISTLKKDIIASKAWYSKKKQFKHGRREELYSPYSGQQDYKFLIWL